MEEEFVDYLQSKGVAQEPLVAEAFLAIERADFMYEGEAESDRPFPIPAQQTISQPYTVAFMLDKLDVKPGMKVLDVGSGSGWTTALLAHIVGEEGEVTGLEVHDELVAFGQKNLAKYKFSQATIKKAQGVYGDPQNAPYDRILVSAAAEGEIPEELITQLKDDGILLCPVDDRIEKITKEGKEVFKGFAFVPLI